MVSKQLKKVVMAFLFNVSDKRLAVSYSAGILTGLLPLYGLRFLIIFLAAIGFGLSFPALVIGLCITILFPCLYSVMDNIFSDWGSILGSSLGPVFASVLIIPAVYSISKLFLKSYVNDENKTTKLSYSLSLGSFAGCVILYNWKIGIMAAAAVLICALCNKLKLKEVLLGVAIGALFFLMFKAVLSEQNLPLFMSGYATLPDFISSIFTGRLNYLLIIILDFIVALCTYPIFKNIYSYKSINRTSYRKMFVFQDSDGFRKSKVARTIVVTSVMAILICGIFSVGLLGNSGSTFGSQDTKELNGSTAYTNLSKDKTNKGTNKTYCFYVDWDTKSLDSFKKNMKLVDVLIPSWYQLNNKGELTGNINTEVMSLAVKNKVSVMPLVNNYINERWDGSLVKKIIYSKANRLKFINLLKDEARKNKFCGFNIDFENLDDDCKDDYIKFISELYKTFKEIGLKVTVDVQPKKGAFDMEKLALNSDSIVLMIYDEHNDKSGQGPIASKDWFENTLKGVRVPSDKIIVGLGLFAYDWSDKSSGKVISMTVPEAMKLYKANNASITWDKKYGNPTFKYNDGKESRTVWLTDSIVAYNQILFSQKLGIHQFSLWRLGSEDEKLWNVFNNLGDVKKADKDLSLTSETVENTDLANTNIMGEVVYHFTKSKLNMGKKLTYNSDGLITDVGYNYKYISDMENTFGSEDKKVALTFDDGPNEKYTPQILDILKRYNVKATFFVIGKNAWADPEILKRAYDEGHYIGNHTYSHPDLPQYSRMNTRYELNMTNKIIEILTGHTTRLFRQPYNVEWDLSSDNEAAVFKEIDSMGYAIVGSAIDPKDWSGIKPEEIVKNVDKQLGKGNIILLHDDGTNVKNTVKALPLIIEHLKSKGYSFETVSDVMHKNREELMPAVKMQETASLMAINLFLTLKSTFGLFVRILFISATIIGILRFVLLLFFATRQRKRHTNLKFNSNYNPKVSIVVAAYNEEKVICKTVNSILEGTYPNIEVLVVNDGSKDSTALVVDLSFCNNPKVRLINKANGGKSSAVNKGFMEASGEIVVVIDADTILDKNAVQMLVRHFENPIVAAVSGNVKVGNKNNFITVCQHIEYVTGLNLERRAFDELNCIPVVPGAIGAWRKELVKDAGYYKEDTLAEDADITLSFLEKGYKIIYEEGAKAYTEAPEDMSGFMKQRLRWSYGTLQCLWKHRKSLFNKNNKILGFIALPNMWLYQFIFQALTPISEAVFLIGLFGVSPIASVLTYLLFFTIDFLITYYAFDLEKEDKKPLKLYFFQRATYRLIMTVIVYKSLFSAVKGVKVGWNKLIRKGNVEGQDPDRGLKERVA